MKHILFIGDSLVEFFDWQQRFSGHTIANLGIAGETVEGLYSRIGKIIRKFPSPDLILIMTGINNVAMEDLGFLDSYRKVVEALSSAYPRTRIVLHTLLPTLLPWIPKETIREMNRLLHKIAQETHTEVLDLYNRFVDPQGNPIKDYLLPDGVHLSEKGYARWVEVLTRIIDKSET
ncbi:MAG TPA: GDSL-type esterase/lipase family protein [Thermodesulfovibrionales bacterium]|nr:GDSL-type esterase/lipase family protein [Thermodesulfovibrionales bacterium]